MGPVNLDDIPSGSLCVIDTNVLVYAEQGVSGQAQRLLRRCSKGELTGMLPQPIWQEFTRWLMLTEATMKYGRLPGSPAASLAKRPDIIRSLSLYQSKVRNLLGVGLRFESCTQDDLLQSAFALQKRHGLLTNDSVVLAMAIRLEADCLASSDKSFQSVEEIAVFAPSDLRI